MTCRHKVDCIVIKDIQKSYGDVTAIKEGFSCNIVSGENTVLLGRNGAGKTTLLNLITNNLFYKSGTITINGVNSTVPESRKGLRYLPDQLEMSQMFTAKQMYQEYSLYSNGYSMDSFMETTKEFECIHLIDHYLSKKSKGQQRLLLLSIVLSGSPVLVILDEPMEGLDPVNIRKVRNRINTLKEKGCTILQSSHRIHEAEKQGGRYLIIHDGRVCSEGRMDNIAEMVKIPKNEYNESLESVVDVVSEIDDYLLLRIKDTHKTNSVFEKATRKQATLEDIYIASLRQLC